jgi:hypothetical protein
MAPSVNSRERRSLSPSVERGRRWLTGQSGAPPDSAVIFSHVTPRRFLRALTSLLNQPVHRTVFGAPKAGADLVGLSHFFTLILAHR